MLLLSFDLLIFRLLLNYFNHTPLSEMKTFKKTFKINAEPSDVYSAITNPYTIELWSGYPAQMSTEPGSEFSLWEGDITGKTLNLFRIKRWFRSGILATRRKNQL